MVRGLLILTTVLLAATSSAADWFTPHAWYSFDILTSYISRGKVYEDRPIQSNEIDVSLGLSDYGTVGFNHWDYSCLSGKYQGLYRRFMPETDWAAYYEYDWKFAEGWSVASQIMWMWKCYHGGKPESDPTSQDARWKQTLKTPYLSFYYKIHYNITPVEWMYYQLGAKRKFAIWRGLSIAPNVAVDFANGAGRLKRFGSRAGGEAYGPGMLSLVVELVAEYKFTDWFSVHATLGQFDILDTGGRDNLSDCSKRDITYGQFGFRLEY